MQKVAALVSSSWLLKQLSAKSSNLRLFDASWHLPKTGRVGYQEYLEGHIPKAQFFSIDDCSDKTSKYDHMLPSAEQFENYVGNLGVNNSTHVVVYDNTDFPLFSAQRVWWMFRYFGHHQVSVLEGGLKKWQETGGEIVIEIDEVPTETFRAKSNPQLVKSFEDVLEISQTKNMQLVDARASGRFHGEQPEPRPGIKPGHIPGALNVPFPSLFDLETRSVKPPDEIKRIFKDAGADLDKPMCVTCGSGVSACVLAIAAFQCGKDDVAVYDGSWAEWYQRAAPDQMAEVPEVEPAAS